MTRNQEELAKYAASMLASGDRNPFDAPDGWGDSETPPPPPHDWAERAARGIISELDDRGAAMNEAFHPEKIDLETRQEIVAVMAAIMREARRQKDDEDK
ncbi:hypothetical protein JC795_26575 [Pseudomonas veronii]|uniref:hypothetical protein n=1 Tax=Pseudomonas veronii TaxID=76761 RepID=UPI0018E8D415|nr:hypothetical protein [Pseudomonas veronii]MBJ2181750.1 hypothetical protein [Pseudomonas veronii]